MSLVEYCVYLKREISMLRAQITKLQADLAEAIAQKNLYEPLIQEPEPEPIPSTKSYWQWFRSRKG